MSTPTIEDFAAALDRLTQVAAGWLRDASWATVGVVAGKLKDQWIALRVYVVTSEDRADAPADLGSTGLNDPAAVRRGSILRDRRLRGT